MKNIWKENKGLIFFWLLTVVIISALLLFLKCVAINNIVQAIAIITLVFVTWFYAKQTKRQAEETKKQAEETKRQAEATKRLVEEGKKKNTADFWEKRINEFYEPFIRYMNDIKDELHKATVDTDRMNKLRKESKYHFWRKQYMTSKATAKKIEDLQYFTLLAEVDKGKERKGFTNYYEAEKKVRSAVKNEWDEIQDKLRKFYGIEDKKI